MITPIILTLILIAYGILNIPLVNQFASPFIAAVLICIVWKLWDRSDSTTGQAEKNDLYTVISEQQKDIKELKEILTKFIPDKKE